MHSYQDELGFLMRFQQYELACNIKINIARKLEDLENSKVKEDNNNIVELYRLLQDTTEFRLSRESQLL